MKMLKATVIVVILSFAMNLDAGWRNSLKPTGQPAGPMTIARDGKSDCIIVIPASATTMEQKAADDLQQVLAEMTGATLPISNDAQPGQQTIRIDEDDSLGDEGYRITVDGQNISLFGGRTRGVVNAIYALLEEDLGCRWYTKTDTRIPKMPTLTFSPVPRQYIPQLHLRDPFYFVSFDPDWSLHNRTNAPDAKVPEAFGGHIDYDGMFVHTSSSLVPPEKYFKTHPEYYALDTDGKRNPAQLCMSNPDVLKIVIASVRKTLAEHPETEIISISKNDNQVECHCPDCTKRRAEEGGTDMANTLTLVNAVAENIEKDYPRVTIDTLAYLDTIGVPKTIRPRKNVAIRLCNDTVGAWTTPFKPARDCPVAKLVQSWSAVCNRLYIWDYNVNFSHYLAPMPNIPVIADNIRFWMANHAEGIMTQGGYQSTAERDELKSWVIAKLMWDPTRDLNALVNDFIYGHYGKSADAIVEYESLLAKAGPGLRDFSGGIRYPMDMPFLSKDFLDQAAAIFAQAEKSADNEEILHRVERAELPILYVKLCRGPAFVGPDYGNILDRFVTIAKREDVTHFAEVWPGDFDATVAAWRKEVPTPATKPAASATGGAPWKVISHGPAAVTYQAFPDICRLKNGDLLCVFYAGYNHISLPMDSLPNGGRICMVRSSDDGRTWSAPQILFDDPDDNRDPSIAQLDDGTVVCTFFSFHLNGPHVTDPQAGIEHLAELATFKGVQMVCSHDNGQTWETTPTSVAKRWACSSPIRQLPDGMCILGVYREDPKTGVAMGGVLRSTDRCKTWDSPIPIDPDSHVYLDAETDIVRLTDGRLLAALRSSKVNLHFATSDDEGKTWSHVIDSGFKGHSPYFLRLSSGEILLAHRIPQTALHISRDDGKTWQGPYQIDDCIGAYPSMVELKDKTALFVYYVEGPGSAIRALRFKVTPDGIEKLRLN